MKNLFKNLWLSVRCVCSESFASEVIFVEDHHARHHRFSGDRAVETTGAWHA